MNQYATSMLGPLCLSAIAGMAASQENGSPERRLPIPVVNAPVAPDTIYIARRGPRAGISVIDLNGFGGGTGDPTYDILTPIVEGNSNFPNNPNVALQGALLIAPLAPGVRTETGGSAGVFTLTRNNALEDLLIERPRIAPKPGSAIGDMMLGAPLDLAFNNGLPFGCQAGGGNLCANTSLQVLNVALHFGIYV